METSCKLREAGQSSQHLSLRIKGLLGPVTRVKKKHLLVEIEVGERELDSLADLLLLHVAPADVRVCHVRLVRRLRRSSIKMFSCGERVRLVLRVAAECNQQRCVDHDFTSRGARGQG